jgi:hypothetical protein
MIKSLAKKAGVGFNGERIRAHCFRKFFDLTSRPKRESERRLLDDWARGRRRGRILFSGTGSTRELANYS